MLNQPLLVLLAIACVAAAVVWGRSTLRLHRAWKRTISAASDAAEADKPDVAASERAAADLARSAFRKELHTTLFYGVVAELALVCSFVTNNVWNLPFLLLYRDPAQGVEELNAVLSATGRPEDLVSLVAVVIDTEAGTLRFASAGHPPAWVWHEGEVRPLRATGPLLTLDPNGAYHSRELPMDTGDLVLLYTDGLAEARDVEPLF